MKSKTSFFNKGIMQDDLRRFGWVGAVHTFALFFLVPLKIIMLYSQEDTRTESVRSLFYYSRYYNHYDSDRLQAFLILTVPVLLGILLFRYMQVKVESDMVHSLPVKRDVLFRSHVSVGVSLLFLPVLITGGICLLLNGALGLQAYYGIGDVLYWVGVSTLMSLVLFTASVFVGMNVGLSSVQGVLTYIMLFLPVGFTLLMGYNLQIFLYGYTSQRDILSYKLSPITRILEGFLRNNNQSDLMGTGEVLAYIAVCGVLYFLSRFLYNKRKLEAASQSLAFRKLHYVFIYGVTFCTMLLSGLYFFETQRNLYWMFFGYGLGSLIGYFAAWMLVKKTFWVFRNIRGYALYAAVVLLMLAGVNLDVLGYESYMPDRDQVESVYFNYYFRDDKPDFFGKNTIENVYVLHKQLIAEKGKNKYRMNGTSAESLVLAYELKNGKRVRRGYSIRFDDYAEYLKPLLESREFKDMNSDILLADAGDIERITITPNANLNKNAVIVDPADIAEALQALKSDIYNETYEEMRDSLADWASVRFLVADDKVDKYPRLYNLNEKTFYTSWKKSYKLLEVWLSQKGYLENARMLPEDVEYAIVEKVEGKQDWEKRQQSGVYVTRPAGLKDAGAAKRLEIKDKDRIEACIRSYEYRWAKEEAQYVVGFYRNGDMEIEVGCFNEKNAPDFVKAFFE